MPEINVVELPKIETPKSHSNVSKPQVVESKPIEPQFLTIAEFKEKIDQISPQVDLKRESRRDVLESRYQENSENTRRYSIENFGDLSQNIQSYRERKTKFQETFDGLSFFKKIKLKREKEHVLKVLKINGIKNADVLIKSLEENASHYIFDYNPERPNDTLISYKSLIQESKKKEEPTGIIKSISMVYSQDNYDVFRKLELFYPHSTHKNPPDLSYLIQQSVSPFIKFSPDKFDQFLIIKEHNPSINLNNDCETFAKKIQDGTFSATDIDRLNYIKKYCSLNNWPDSKETTEDIQTKLKIYESAFIQHKEKGTQHYHDSSNMFSAIIEECTDLNREMLFSLVNSGVEIDIDENYSSYSNKHFNRNFDPNNSSLIEDAQFVYSGLNSSDGEYLKSLIPGLVNPNLKTLAVFAKNIDFLKSIDSQKVIRFFNNYNRPTLKEDIFSKINQLSEYIDESGFSTDKYLTDCLTRANILMGDWENLLEPDKLVNLSEKDQRFWNLFRDTIYKSDTVQNLLVLKNVLIKHKENINDLFDENNRPRVKFFEECIQSSDINPSDQFIIRNVKTALNRYLNTVYFNNLKSPEDKKILNIYRDMSTIDGIDTLRFIFVNQDKLDLFFDENNRSTSKFYEEFFSQYGLPDSLDETFTHMFESKDIELFSDEDQKFWNFINNDLKRHTGISLQVVINNKSIFFEKLCINGNLTKDFFDIVKKENEEKFEELVINGCNKKDWETLFGKKTIDYFLSSLPTKTDEKRNAFTHNEYDRTSDFLRFLLSEHNNSSFILDEENLKITADYIKLFGLSRTSTIFRYFKELTQFEQGKIPELSRDCLDSNITSINQLKTKVDNIRQLSLNSKPLNNLSELTPIELNLLSIATGHSSNRWTRTPIEIIVSDFSRDLLNKNIAPLSPEYSVSSAQVEKIKINNTVDLETNETFQTFSQEILSSIKNTGNIDDLKKSAQEIFNRKIQELSSKTSNDFISKQLEVFNSGIQQLENVSSTDEMISTLLSLNINFGQEQENYNSILRQLVYRKVLIKHNSPNFIEDLRISLENNPGANAISNGINFLNNLVKDHALDFKTNNQEKYWSEQTFTNIKKFEKVFRKNLAISNYSKELESIYDQLEVVKLDTNLNISMVPDRGLIGELAGYMADVCYTKVYPLLKTYPNLVPYKFIGSPESPVPEFIGSTLVFQVETTNNEPALLIRAFNIPKEQDIDTGDFFEKFVDSLSETAKKLGIKKIIAAGTAGTISNYPLTTNYVLSKYVKEKPSVPLRDFFNFNGYDITTQCYLVRDLD